MAKKTPKIETSAVESTPAVEPQKAAVNVETTNEPKKNKNKKTPSQKEVEKKPNIFKRMWKALKGVFSELKKVNWLKGKDVMKNSAVVLVVVVVFFVILFVIDYVLSGLLGLTVDGKWTTIFI